MNVSVPEVVIAPPPAAAGTASVACPSCRSTQFVVTRKMSALGHLLMWPGLVIVLVSLPAMAIFVGFLTLPIGLVMMIVGAFMRKYQNVCVSCRRGW